MSRIDNTLLTTWGLCLGFGLVMVASTTLATANPLASQHALHLLLALMAFAAVLIVPLRFWRACYWPVLGLALALALLVVLPGMSREINGAHRWLDLGVFSVQPAEIAKASMVIFLAGYLSRNDQTLQKSVRPLTPVLAIYGLLATLLMLEPDFGSTLLIGALVGAMLLLAGLRTKHFLILAAAGLILANLAAVQESYRLTRVLSFLDPWATALSSGYQLTHSLIAFGRGEVWGLGLGEGIQKLWYLPDAHNDFIYAVVAEELGLVGALTLLALLALLVLRILRSARSAFRRGDRFAAYLCYGVAILLGLQVLTHVGVTTGSLPTKGLTLPFISYGGNSLIICSALVALVCRTQMEGNRT